MAYILSPEDTGEFVSIYSKVEGIERIVQLGEDVLHYINPAALVESQKPYLAVYLVAYAAMRPHPDTIRKLEIILRKLGISTTHARNIRRKLAPVCKKLLEKKDRSPLSLAIQPPDELYRGINHIASEALADGSYKYRRVVDNLSPDEFQHDSDRMYLEVLKKTKGLDTVIRAYMKYGGERLDTLPIIGGALQLGDNQLPEIYDLITDASVILNMRNIPPFYAAHFSLINAFAIGVENPMVVFTSKLLEDLNHTEQLFIIGHELGHIKSEHQLYRMIGGAISGGLIGLLSDSIDKFSFGLSGLLTSTLQVALANWSRASEMTCDRAGLLCCQDIDVALRALMKLAGLPRQYQNSMSIEGFKEQIRNFKLSDENLKDKMFRLYLAMYDSHPWIVMRGHELLKWYESGEYERVLNRIPPVREQSREPARVGYSDPGDETVTSAEANGSQFCSNCGQKTTPGSKFCSGCGNSL